MLPSFRLYLKEDYSTDDLIRQEALYVWSLLEPKIKKIGNPNNPGSGWQKYDYKKKFMVGNVGQLTKLPQYNDLSLGFTEDYWFSDQASYNSSWKLIRIKEAEMFNKGFDWSAKLEKWKYNFVHEFIHYTDFTRRFKPDTIDTLNSKYYSSRDSRELYINCPIELNAYYQGSVTELDNEVQGIIKTSTKVTAMQDKQKYQLFLYLNFAKFTDFWQYYYKKFEGRFIEFLSPENRQRYQKRLYSYWYELVRPKAELALGYLKSRTQ